MINLMEERQGIPALIGKTKEERHNLNLQVVFRLCNTTGQMCHAAGPEYYYSKK